MRKTKLFAVLLMTALTLCCLSGCMSVSFSSTYDDSDKYTAGDREITEQITDLDINWTSGSITVSRHNLSTVSIKETCDEELDDAKKVHT